MHWTQAETRHCQSVTPTEARVLKIKIQVVRNFAHRGNNGKVEITLGENEFLKQPRIPRTKAVVKVGSCVAADVKPEIECRSWMTSSVSGESIMNR